MDEFYCSNCRAWVMVDPNTPKCSCGQLLGEKESKEDRTPWLG